MFRDKFGVKTELLSLPTGKQPCQEQARPNLRGFSIAIHLIYMQILSRNQILNWWRSKQYAFQGEIRSKSYK
jgi:hypothetical protein